jgi:hypothetical protein
MRIAMIVPYPIMPPDEGGRVRAYNLVKQLSRAHEVLVLSPRSPAYSDWDLAARVEQTTSPGRARQILDAGSIAGASWRAVSDFAPDVIVTEYPWAGVRAAIMARRLGVPLLFDAPNVEGDRFRRTGSRAWRGVDL